MHKLGFGAFPICLCWQCMCASCMQYTLECRVVLHKLCIPLCYAATKCTCRFDAKWKLCIPLCYADLRCTCRFDAKCKRIQAESPHGRRPAWAVRPVIVKSGDDCRQELLAVQLISTFYDIFQASRLLSEETPSDLSMHGTACTHECGADSMKTVTLVDKACECICTETKDS